MLQLDSLDADLNIFKQETQLSTISEVTTLAEIALNGNAFQAKLVRIENVEFICDDLNNSFADEVNQESLNRYLQDEIGNQLIVRTSGYSNFANQIIPSGNGTVTAIVSQYNDDVQLLLRRPSEAQLINDRIEDCDGTGGGNGNGAGPASWETEALGCAAPLLAAGGAAPRSLPHTGPKTPRTKT